MKRQRSGSSNSIALPQPVDDPQLITALAMTGAHIAQNQLGLSGRGVKVGIIDTGIDYHHPDLGGSGLSSTTFPTARVTTGWDFVRDAHDAGANPVPVPDPYPDDCAGHGTHVAGIVGASGIVNMSIGAAFGWPQWPTAMAGTRLVNKGVVVVASIRNSGSNGIYAASAPGLGSKVIGVPSFDNTHINLASFTLSSDASIGYIAASGALPAHLSGTFPLSRTGTPTSTADGCTALPANSLAGTIALIRRGTCSFYIKATNAQKAGASGVVLYNNTMGVLSANAAGALRVTIPVVGFPQRTV